jgi:serine/threonine-protein kinase
VRRPRPGLATTATRPATAAVPQLARARTARARILALAPWAIGALTGAGVAVALLALRRPAPPTRPVVRFGIQLPRDAEPVGARGSTIAFAPSGSQVVYVGKAPSGQRLYSRRMDLPDPVPVPGSEGGILPFFSPDEQFLGFVQGGRIVKVPVGGGPVTPICTVRGEVFGATWLAGDTIVFASESGLMEVPAAGGTVRGIAHGDSIETFSFPEGLPGGRSVLFGITAHGTLTLAALDRRTGKVKRLSQPGGYPRYVTGGFLVLTHPAGIISAVPFDVGRLEVAGPARTIDDKVNIDVTGDFNLGVSRSGDLAYQPSAGDGDRIVLVDRSGTASPIGADSGYLYVPRLSPDGRRVVVVRGTGNLFTNRDLWVFDLLQHTQTRVTFDTTAAWPVWSPDGREIVYTRFPGGTNTFEARLYVVPADGSGSPRALGDKPGAWQATGFEPGGRGIVYSGVSAPQGKQEIWRLGLDSGATPVQVLANNFNNAAPTLSPDGRWLAYTSDESGRSEVYVRSYPGQGGRWQVSLDGGAEPVWSPKGDEIFYRQGDDMMAAGVRSEPAVEITARTRLFKGNYQTAGFFDQDYGVSRDGRQFVMLTPLVTARQSLVVTLNWFDALRRR